MPLDFTRDAVETWDVVEAFEARLKAGLAAAVGGAKPQGTTRIVASPDGQDGGALKAEPGVHILVGDPQPTTLDGATRSGMRVRLVFQLWIVTRNNQDRAGEDRIALKQHLKLHDAVINSLIDTPPVGTPVGQQNQVGITCHWIPGGNELKRVRSIAPDHFVSVQLFEVKYIQRTQVVRVTEFD